MNQMERIIRNDKTFVDRLLLLKKKYEDMYYYNCVTHAELRRISEMRDNIIAWIKMINSETEMINI